jgi:hypothetical protein
MIIRIEKRQHPFVQIDKRPLENPKLSWKAKGLLAYLMSRPNDWKIYMAQLVKVSTDGRVAVQAALAELRAAGHASIRQIRSPDNRRAVGSEWVIHEEALRSGFPDSQEKLTLSETTATKNDSIEKKNNLKTYELPTALADLKDTWEAWLRYKRERRNPMTPTTCKLQVAKLLTMGVERGRAAMLLAMERGWQGFGFNGHAPLDLRGKTLDQLDKMAKERRNKLHEMTRRYGDKARETGAVGKTMKQLDAELREITAATNVILDRLADEVTTTKGQHIEK